MTKRPFLLFGASALALGLAQASAQDVDYVDECVDLFAFVEDAPDMDLDSEPDIVAVIERNDPRACQLRLNRLERAARTTTSRDTQPARAATQDRQVTQTQEGEADVTTATREVQERVQLEEVVTVQGDVDVVAPVPNVQVRPEPATVEVRGEAPRVTVRQGQPEIVVREQPAQITVGMPTITIEQPAPEIVITMPAPGVDVAMAEPQVEVRQAPPRVSVAVPEPRVDLNLRAVAGETNEEVRTRVTRERGAAREEQGLRLIERGDQGADANVYVAEVEPQVQVTGMDGEAQVDVQDAEPNVRFEGAEPEVTVTGEPEIRFERTGEPQVRIERAGAEGEDQAQRFADTTGEDRAEPGETRRERRARRAAAASGATAAMTVGDVTGRTVYGTNGEEVGDIERVIRMDGQVYAVVEHGGFLGLGDTDIPVPVGDLRMDGDRLVASNLTSDRAEQMQANDIDRGEDLDDEEALDIR